ncbi:hypothetical protein N7495_009053 [Penicillium taxi]|uniref:uncharacterized protein n=1 Tax=Penicillium taxi TaxID=168475 RepID=UPI0025455D8D|nr:uncharacterized protein N7495_009053 [Penicillium taxi]KAJ5889012.1 hypothetical protein N7495_009053 [Penicillium taxi]
MNFRLISFSTAVIGSALAADVFTAPLTTKRQAHSKARLVRRSAQRQSNPPIKRVGIDGDIYETAILQVGVDFCITGSDVSYDAWYEWYPDYAYDFDNFEISAGNVIKVTIDATSSTGGTAIIENISTGNSATHSFSNVTDGSLCEYNAGWIVEDFESDSELIDFANFGTVTFSDAIATSGNTSYGPSTATIMDIKQADTVLTYSSVTDDIVTITYYKSS